MANMNAALLAKWTKVLNSMAISGTGVTYNKNDKIDIYTFDFGPVFEDLRLAHTIPEIGKVLDKHGCNQPGVAQILIDVGAITCVSQESEIYDGGLVSVQPMTQPSGLIYHLNYKYSKSKSKRKSKKK